MTINDSFLSDGLAKYVAGTQFSDTFTGENNVSNTYYYVGSASGSAPTDTFTGGGGTAWNVAILPDALSNYHISTFGETTTLANIGDPQHAGTLNLTGVQEVVFDPSVDPSGNSGLLEAFAGSTVLLLGPLSNVSEPAQIDGGATLAIDTPASGTVTFAAGATGTLILAQPSAFTGSIAGLAAGDVIDLIGTVATSATISGSTLTVFDDGTAVKTLNISGAQSGDVVVVGGDGNTGNPGSDLTIEPAAYVWDDITFPESPARIFTGRSSAPIPASALSASGSTSPRPAIPMPVPTLSMPKSRRLIRSCCPTAAVPAPCRSARRRPSRRARMTSSHASLPCGSRSMTSTFSPTAASAVPRLMVVVVFPDAALLVGEHEYARNDWLLGQGVISGDLVSSSAKLRPFRSNPPFPRQ